MHFLLGSILLSTLIVLPQLAQAQDTVTDKLLQKKQSFLEKADQKKIDDYEEGIRTVADSGVIERAKQKGDKAPDFTLPNAVGEEITLSNLLKDGPVVLIWYRGEWCPYCNVYLADIQAHMKDFKEAGANVIAISPETPDHGSNMQDRLSLDFHVLSDEQSGVAEEYGVVYTLPPKIATHLQDAFDIHGANNDERNLLPLSASYIINTDGTISYAYLNADYRERAETNLLLEEVKKLKH